MFRKYITNAKLMDYNVKGQLVILTFLLPDNTTGMTIRVGPRYEKLQKMVGRWMQVEVCCNVGTEISFEYFKKAFKDVMGRDPSITVNDHKNTILVSPTFFDLKECCKKCGRFYKVYCKNCYPGIKK